MEQHRSQNPRKGQGPDVKFGPIRVERLVHPFDTIPEETRGNSMREPNYLSAWLRQETTTTYPSVRPANSHSDSLVDASEFVDENDTQERVFHSSRVAFQKVPKHWTIEDVQKRLQKYPKARILRKLTLDIKTAMSAEQKNAVATGLVNKTMDDYERDLVAKYPAGHPQEGQPIFYNGLPMYMVRFLSLEGGEDIDLRPQDYQRIAAEKGLSTQELTRLQMADQEQFIPDDVGNIEAVKGSTEAAQENQEFAGTEKPKPGPGGVSRGGR